MQNHTQKELYIDQKKTRIKNPKKPNTPTKSKIFNLMLSSKGNH